MNAEQLRELATKNPEIVVETPEEMLLREQVEQLYYNSGGRKFSGLSGFAAGWIAAKAYYEARN